MPLEGLARLLFVEQADQNFELLRKDQGGFRVLALVHPCRLDAFLPDLAHGTAVSGPSQLLLTVLPARAGLYALCTAALRLLGFGVQAELEFGGV